MSGKVKVNGVWQNISGSKVKVNGTWQDVSKSFTKVNGEWKEWLSSNTYWLSLLGGFEDDDLASVAIDSADNIYVLGFRDSQATGTDDFLLAKYNPSGTVQWQRTLGGPNNEEGKSVAIDSADNVYVLGFTEDEEEDDDRDILLAKYNSSGTIQWQRILRSEEIERAESVAIDSADNVYVLGLTLSPEENSYDILLAKYNSAGTVQWQRALGRDEDEGASSLAIDSANNVYVLGQTDKDSFLLAKYNSSGIIQWQRTLGNSNTYSASVAIDSADNIYVLGSGPEFDFLLAKYNPSGTVQWQRTLGNIYERDYAESVAIDSADNVYVFGSTILDDRVLLLAKYNPSGTIQWQRILYYDDKEENYGYSVAIDSADNIYVFGAMDKFGALLAKLPNDGSLEGTYLLNGKDIKYEAGGLSIGVASLTGSSGNLLSSSISLTSLTPSLTSASVNFTTVIKEIG